MRSSNRNWLTLGGAAVLMLVLAALARPLAGWLGQPMLAPLAWAATPLVLMAALNLVPQALMQRQMRFRPLAARAMAGTLAGALVGVGLAAAGAGVWSLVHAVGQTSLFVPRADLVALIDSPPALVGTLAAARPPRPAPPMQIQVSR